MAADDLRDDKKDRVKTEKVDQKGKGATEKVLFDDGFDWESFDEKAKGKVAPNEKLAELDVMELEDEELAPKPKPGPREQGEDLDTSFRFKESKPAPEKPSKKASAFLARFKARHWAAAAAILIVVPLVSIATWMKITSSGPDPNALRPDQVTKEIRTSIQELVPLKPFMVPVSKNSVNAISWVSPTLVVQSYGTNVVKEKIEAIRGEIYNVLISPQPDGTTLNGNKLAKQIQGRINNYLGVNLVERVQIVIKDPIITNQRSGGPSDYS